MGRFRKKPVEVEAIQFAKDGSNWIEVHRFMGVQCPLPLPGIVTTYSVEIRTLEGTMRASRGDWIIRGVRGEYYPCKPDMFESTYERIED
jgi:hypothetical protein